MTTYRGMYVYAYTMNQGGYGNVHPIQIFSTCVRICNMTIWRVHERTSTVKKGHVIKQNSNEHYIGNATDGTRRPSRPPSYYNYSTSSYCSSDLDDVVSLEYLAMKEVAMSPLNRSCAFIRKCRAKQANVPKQQLCLYEEYHLYNE